MAQPVTMWQSIFKRLSKTVIRIQSLQKLCKAMRNMFYEPLIYALLLTTTIKKGGEKMGGNKDNKKKESKKPKKAEPVKKAPADKKPGK